MKQQAIAAAHHLDTVRDQAAGLVLARIVLKVFLGAAKAEQDFGDGAQIFRHRWYSWQSHLRASSEN